MSLVRYLVFEDDSMPNLESITSEGVVGMLENVRKSLGDIDSCYNSKGLDEILEIITQDSFEINDGGDICKVDFREPKSVIKMYKDYSDGGCQSCNYFGEFILDSGKTSNYCVLSEKAENPSFTAKTRYYYYEPCSDWNPYFEHTIDELVSEAQAIAALRTLVGN